MKISEDMVQKHGIRFKESDIIFDENEPADQMYLILTGKVGIHKKVKEAFKLLIELKEGDMFGEMALVDRKPRSARAIAKTDVLLFAITESVFYSLIQTNPSFSLKMVKMLSSRLRETNQTIASLLKGDRKNLVTSALITFSQTRGEQENGMYKVHLAAFTKWAILRVGLEHQDLATAINLLIKDKLVEQAKDDPHHIYIRDTFFKYTLDH
ncbi:cyclic nucleotide-binding domain-containing protein [Leptospira langatensis]|uniref:Cyclic nucleotide-binding domain-containing protein n=1 Tax=Leptospira langatensis TaxID=2484983 RepID=A0A5F1ZUY6_9LEPT|nr:cyclic nucleotide-binding domain-containing protein [Leptospira langatensis]TGK00302.1 cyclic nucleotide-binding domain-containing protein [Leptospira langatensis]TGL41062.1 cyclic nucleotide-binding domain-containing protein [Leptospira langatensis]